MTEQTTKGRKRKEEVWIDNQMVYDAIKDRVLERIRKETIFASMGKAKGREQDRVNAIFKRIVNKYIKQGIKRMMKGEEVRLFPRMHLRIVKKYVHIYDGLYYYVKNRSAYMRTRGWIARYVFYMAPRYRGMARKADAAGVEFERQIVHK